MSFDKFLLAVESRDLSQADKSNKGGLLSQSCVMGSRTVIYTNKNKLFDTWQFGKIDFLVNFTT